MYDDLDAERRAAFDSDMTPQQIKTFSIKNRLPKNVIYKMLEKYHYLTFLKKCKKIMKDGRVTDDEIKSLQKENALMQTFLEFNEITGTGAVAGAGDDSETVPVHMDKMKKKRKEVLKRFIQAQEDSKQKWSR
jgi:hypothetical protein